MLRGGYQIIDLAGYDYTSETTHTVVGLYELIEGSNKPIFLSGIKVDGVEYHDTFIFPFVNNTKYQAIVGENPLNGNKLAVTFEDDGKVIFSVIQPTTLE